MIKRQRKKNCLNCSSVLIFCQQINIGHVVNCKDDKWCMLSLLVDCTTLIHVSFFALCSLLLFWRVLPTLVTCRYCRVTWVVIIVMWLDVSLLSCDLTCHYCRVTWLVIVVWPDLPLLSCDLTCHYCDVTWLVIIVMWLDLSLLLCDLTCHRRLLWVWTAHCPFSSTLRSHKSTAWIWC